MKLQKKEEDLEALEGKALTERRENANQRLEELAKKIETSEKVLLKTRLEEHYGAMTNFIRTKAQPTIFYMPAKHNKATEEALEETKAAIKEKIASFKGLAPETE